MAETFSAEQLAQLEGIVDKAVRQVFADAGLRVDEGDHEDEARKDFAFLRSVRRTLGGWATSIGWVVILSVISAVIWLIQSGLTFWKGH